MFSKCKIVIIPVLLAIAGCARFNELTCDRCYTPAPRCVYEQHPSYANDAEFIALQNPQTRIIVQCYTSERNPAEFCAQQFEKKGYIRLREMPYKAAEYDFLHTDTYPTRRWRNGEVTPRW